MTNTVQNESEWTFGDYNSPDKCSSTESDQAYDDDLQMTKQISLTPDVLLFKKRPKVLTKPEMPRFGSGQKHQISKPVCDEYMEHRSNEFLSFHKSPGFDHGSHMGLQSAFTQDTLTTPKKFQVEGISSHEQMEYEDFEPISESSISIGDGLLGSCGKYSEFEKQENGGISQNVQISATEFDRFIPNRPLDQDLASNYEKKEFLFARKLFNCNHAVNEQCGPNTCGKDRHDAQQEQAQPKDVNHKMFNTLLCSQLFQAENPHRFQLGSHNDDHDEDMGGLIQADRLPLKYNALDFRQPEKTSNNLNFAHDDNNFGGETSANFGASSPSCNDSFIHDPMVANQPQRQLPQRSCLVADENKPFQLPVFAGFEEQELLSEEYKKQRVIPQQPFKVLDAPCLQDDFYLNLVDWSAKNVLAVGLGSCIYLWSAMNSQVTKLSDIGPNNNVTSVQWSRDGQHFAVGTDTGELQIWDTTKNKLIRTMQGHDQRICAVAWNNTFLSTGSRDHNILHRDLRSPQDFTAKLEGHRQEVCGLKWSFDDQQLASGGNDNKLLLWCARSNSQPLAKFNEHQAAVKAIAWSPHKQGLLVSGGGTQDRTIKFWNTNKLKCLRSIETGSQVCNLMFAKNVNELVSTHGYSQNQINVWRYPSMKKLATLTGHSYRVLYLAASPDGRTLVTGAGDETLRFWNVFPPKKTTTTASIVMPSFSDMR